jgi:CRISPR-associated protein Cas5d
MTPSAARGILEAILWKPAITWHIERIYVLSPIQFTAFRRNEVNTKASGPSATVINNGGPAPIYFAEEDRAQRNTVALRDVDYMIEAYFTMTEKAGPEDNINKFVEMFKRRVEKGQHFHQPYLGCREFIAEILPADNVKPASGEDKDLGLMLWDIDFGEKNTPVYFPARLEKGILEVPEKPSKVLAGGKGGGK